MHQAGNSKILVDLDEKRCSQITKGDEKDVLT